MKKNVCFLLMFHAEFKFVIRSALSLTVFVWEKILKFTFCEFSFFLWHYQYVLNIDEYFIIFQA